MAKASDTHNCTIGEGSIFEGRFFVNGSILIEGKFKGEIKTNEELIVGPTGRVRTDITARRVTVAGTVIGNITASEEVNLVQTGRVLGDITTPRLNVEQGVITEGQVTITGGKDESIRKLVEEAYGPEAADEFKTLLNEKPSGRRADKSGSEG